MDLLTVILLIIFAAVGGAVGYLIAKTIISKKQALERADAERIRADAEAEARKLLKEAQVQAKEEALKIKMEAEEEASERKGELRSQEKRLLQREEQVEKKKELVDHKEIELLEKEKRLKSSEAKLKQRQEEIERLVNEQRNLLEKISGMSSNEAREHLLKSFEAEVRQDAGKMLRKIEAETKEIADKKAREIIALAVARYAGEYVADRTVSVVALPNEEMKGRIIGREGRNIDAITLARTCETLGAGEILLNCIDRDGTNIGFDIELINAVKAAVSIPVIASSGAGCVEHFLEVFSKTEAEAALAAGIFHRNEVPLGDVKRFLSGRVAIRR